MEKFFSKLEKNSKPVVGTSSSIYVGDRDNETNKRIRINIRISDHDIIVDPELRKPIDSYHVELRDKLRRRYLAKGPCQPHDHSFPTTIFGVNHRSFQANWFKAYDWLEYSISKDATFCLWCYLFASGLKNGDNIFTEISFRNWRKGIAKFKSHQGRISSSHNYARMKCFGYQYQRHNVDYAMMRQSSQMEDHYRIRLTAVVKVIRYLVGQGLHLRGNDDESASSLDQSNFLKLVDWFCAENEDVRKVMNLNAPENNQLTSPKIQKDIINACATDVRNYILIEIGDECFSLLIDEARDNSIKEQMYVVLRFVNNFGEVIERFLRVVHVHDTSSQSLKNAIDEFLGMNGLSLRGSEVKNMMMLLICAVN